MLRIENLFLSYGENKVLNDISLNIADGECVLLTGESGSGKSSIINSINGLAFEYENAQLSGSIKVGEKEIKNLEPVFFKTLRHIFSMWIPLLNFCFILRT